MRTITQGSIRTENLLRIWDMIAENPGITRQELAQGLNLSLMTVSNLVDILQGFDSLRFVNSKNRMKSGKNPRKVGRKADRISLNPDGHAWLALDLTDQHFRFTVLALDASIIQTSESWDYDHSLDFQANLLAFLETVGNYIQTRLKKREVIGMAVIVPGPFDVEEDYVNNQRIPALTQIKIKALLRKTLGPYSYYVDEDVKFAVRAYLPDMRASECQTLYYLFVGEGVGGASMLNGSVLCGLNSVAGDFGQLLLNGQSCESLISLRAFIARIGGQPSQNMNQQQLLDEAMNVAHHEPDRYAKNLEDVADIIAQLLHQVVWMLDPMKIVLDCIYAPPMEDFFIKKVRQALKEKLSSTLKMPEILLADKEMPGVLLGAWPVISHDWIRTMVRQ